MQVDGLTIRHKNVLAKNTLTCGDTKNLCFVEDLLSCLFGAFLVIIERDRGGRWKYS